ncbi:MAG: hypothetical protein IPK26_26470 [Planctomycetes bacterium]|nr:hypothetical protein [Planctomycetota bacterium]
MPRWLLLMLWCLLALPAVAQDRIAKVELEDGRVLQGRVVAMDIAGMRIEVDGLEVAIDARTIRVCTFTTVGEPPAEESGQESGESGNPGSATGSDPGTAPEVTAPPSSGDATEGGTTGTGGEPEPESADQAGTGKPPKSSARTRVRRPPPEPPAGAKDRRSPGRRRLEALDRAYPWLAPEQPVQWFSLGLTLFALLSLCVHGSARIALSENLLFGRSCWLAAWILVSTILQVAILPSATPVLVTAALLDLGIAWALFRWLFGLGVGTGILAVGVLGMFVGAGFCILQVIDMLLLSIGGAAA